MAQIGMPLIEAGVIYLIFRLLFLHQGDEVEIEALEKENATLRQSASIGIAETYFWNFIHPVASSIKAYDDDNEEPECVSVEKDENGKEQFN
jgi:hypothetical protein